MIPTQRDEGDEEPRYRLGGRERRGLLAGWRAGQIIAVASGLVVAVGLLRVVPGGLGIALALLVVLCGVASACWPVRGRTLDEWVPAVGRHLVTGLAGRRSWRSKLPRRGGPGETTGGFGLLEIEEVETGVGGPLMGSVRDRAAGTSSAVLVVSGTGYALLAPAERCDRVASWSRLLASLARDGTGVYRLQWIDRCVPDDVEALRRRFEGSDTDGFVASERRVEGAGKDGSVAPIEGPGDGPAVRLAAGERRSYSELLDLVGNSFRHELYLVVTVRDRSSAGRRGVIAGDASHRALLEEAASLEGALRQMGAAVEGVLSPAALRRLLAETFRSAPGRAAESPWPLATEVGWQALRTDATWHASYWISEWPRSDVGNDFLLPLLTSSVARRTLSVTMAPVAPLRASRAAEHARTSGVADAELRRSHGFAVTARARRDHDAVLRREAELAGGHASYRFSGFVTVTDTDPDRLEGSCQALERVAASCQLELRRLYGSQDLGLMATLPVGRGIA